MAVNKQKTNLGFVKLHLQRPEIHLADKGAHEITVNEQKHRCDFHMHVTFYVRM